jgi:ureidoacrylate peracid hydrolase
MFFTFMVLFSSKIDPDLMRQNIAYPGCLQRLATPTELPRPSKTRYCWVKSPAQFFVRRSGLYAQIQICKPQIHIHELSVAIADATIYTVYSSKILGFVMELHKEKAALIVIDMQNSFCKRDGLVAAIGLDTSACEAAIEPCRENLALAREAGIPVFFTRYVYEQDYSDGGVMIQHMMPELAQVKALKAGSHDADIVPELTPQPGETVIDKNRPSSFFNTDLAERLDAAGRSQLVVCGVTTNCCVESTVRDASHRDLEVFVIGDACGELDDERHTVALRSMDMLFADVIDSERFAQAMQ